MADSELEIFFDNFIANERGAEAAMLHRHVSTVAQNRQTTDSIKTEENDDVFLSLLPDELIKLEANQEDTGSGGTTNCPSQDYKPHSSTAEADPPCGPMLELMTASPTAFMTGIIPQIQNVVSSVKLGCSLDLALIASKAWNIEYKPKTYKALVMRIRKPRTTAMIYSSGNIVCAGAKSEEQSRVAARKFARILQKLGFPVAFLDFSIQNVVASGRTCQISLDRMSDHPQCSWEPELFPGLFYHVMPGLTMIVFSSGKISLSGAKTEAEIYKVFEIVFPTLCCYRKE